MDLFKSIDDESIDCVITSPPYWQLRDYGWNGQWGLEPTYKLYLEHLWDMMKEVYRVLNAAGTVFINLGDTYSGSNGFGWKQSVNNKNQSTGGINENIYYRKETGRVDNEPNKCLLLIPHRFAIGCIDLGFIMRNDIIWAKRNAMPESVTDRFSKKHEYIFFMTKNEEYYFDLDGIRDKLKNPTFIRNKASEIYGRGSGSEQFSKGSRMWGDEKKGKNPGSVSDFWDITTKPSKGVDHYATYNNDLIGRPIIAGCPKDGVILDPFCGTATTGCRALELGRNFIGFEGSEKYVKIANSKLLPYQVQQQMF